MKTKICILGLLLMVSLPAGATLYQSGTLDAGTVIPDNNYIGTGDNLTYTLSGAGAVITDVALTFTLQGGSSGDLSGYLRLGNGAGSPYYDLTSLIQGTAEAPGGTTYTIDFGTSGFQTAFNGQNPNNTWTLFFADTVQWRPDDVERLEPGRHRRAGAGERGAGRVWRTVRCRGSRQDRPPKESGMIQRLAQISVGRMILHVGCLCRGGRWTFHLAGVRREWRAIWKQ